MRHVRFWLSCALLLVLPAVARAQEPQQEPQDQPQTPKTVDEKLEELDQKIRVLDRKIEIDKEAAAEKAKTAASTTIDKTGFTFKSADGAYQLKIRGYVQLDSRFFLDDDQKPAIDTFTLRRVRPIFEGTLAKIFDFRIMPDFGGGTTVLQDAYMEARFNPAFRVRAGKFKPPVGLERLQSAVDLLFVERALPTNLVPNRDLGVQISGDFAGGAISYQAGVFNGVVDGGNGDGDTNDEKDVAGPPLLPAVRRRHGPVQEPRLRRRRLFRQPVGYGRGARPAVLPLARAADGLLLPQRTARPPTPPSPTAATSASCPRPTSTAVPSACWPSTRRRARTWRGAPSARPWTTAPGRWRRRG